MSSNVSDVPADAEPRDDEISLLDFAIVLAKFKWLIIGIPIAAAAVAAVMSLSMPNIYTASARLLPPQQGGSLGGGLSGALGQIGGALGLGGAFGAKSPSDLFVGILRSRTIANAMIDRFGLMEVYKAAYRSDAQEALAGATSISVGRDGMITIEVQDPDPKRAAQLANGYAEEIEKLVSVMAVTEASQRRLFLERQFGQAKETLLKTELAVRAALDEGGVTAVDVQGKTIIQAAAGLRAQVTAKEVQLASMRGFMTEQHPEYKRAQQELAAVREQLAKIERGGADASKQMVEVKGFRNATLLRELRYHETLFDLLAQQYQVAKVEEAKEGVVVQVLDKAVPPERRSKPQRRTIVLITALAAVLAAIVLAFILEALQRARRDPRKRERLRELGGHLWPGHAR